MIDVLIFMGVFLITYKVCRVVEKTYEHIKTQQYWNKERVYFGLETKPLTLKGARR